ncbi:restriction endonuclease subunit S [Clostridium thermosuccinogenes]|uniref:restriction endonuclease subunit S n=1 Tax=Clostridium thermosuccinogenes TaxID=84032 RepID=UPI000CCC6A95|nr:restriction endonuclease subunit S [Pseudoclostridium thermosuccinogenes]PNT90336.1 restriction endonuclease subunit S [Pseudoclostridium thermosuccinogenes]
MSKFKKYERYKDSGVEWIGEIPEHWDITKLGYRARMIVPMRDKPTEFNGNIPWIRIEDVDGKYIEDSKSEQRVSEELVKKMNLKVYPIGTVLCTCSCNMGSTVIVKKPLISNQTFIGIVPMKDLDSTFLYYAMNANSKRLQHLAEGAIQQYLSRHDFEHLKLAFPDKKEQTAIANFLDQKTAEIDGLIAEKEKLIELLQEKRQAIITEAVTKGLNPNARMKDSGVDWIGEIPEHWRLSKIKYESLINNKTLSESTDDDYEIDYIDISSVTSIGEIDGVQSLNFKDAPSRARRILYKGDTIVSTVRTYLKAIAFIENAQSNLICSTGFAVLTPLSKVVPKYLFYLMRSEKYVNEIVRRSVGVSYPAINASDIGALGCAIPDKDEQKYIVEYLDNCTTQVDELVNDIQTQIQKLKEYRQSLISEAVTGKIDVKEFADKVEVI